MSTLTTPDLFVVTDETTAEEIVEAIVRYNDHAKRQQHHPDCRTWVNAHRRINVLLHDWQART